MARQNSALENNSFSKGIITEASPLNFPEGASLDERNFIIERDGSRRRRLGMDFESGSSPYSSSDINTIGGELVITTYNWSDAGKTATNIVVVQAGRKLLFFDSSFDPLSDGLIADFQLDNPDDLSTPYEFSYSSVSGILVVASGKEFVDIFTYENGSVSKSTDKIRVRDIWGVVDPDPSDSEVDYREDEYINVRAGQFSITDNHLYNLRNQTWAEPRKQGGPGAPSSDELIDTLLVFVNRDAEQTYPSNADSINVALYPDPEISSDPHSDRFWHETIRNAPRGTTEAPRGYFIIDLLNRSKSRLEAVDRLVNSYPDALVESYMPGTLPLDRTEDGPSVVGSFGGRVWFAGFNGSNVGGDKYSPNLKSYVTFSRLVDGINDATRCYQKADPTSPIDPDLVDTDGGVILISGAQNIQHMVELGTSLIVMASNGVWAISGGSDYGFTATNYRVSKITDIGLVSKGSVVEVESGIVYWAQDGIYSISGSSIEGFSVQSLTQTTIQTLYNEIGSLEKTYSRGLYDKFDKKIRWLYNCREDSVGPVKELVFDTTIGAFYLNDIARIGGGYPLVAGLVEVPPFRAGDFDDPVVVNGDQVTVNSEDVVVSARVKESAVRSVKYVTMTKFLTYGLQFSEYRDTDFLDWASYSLGDPVDAPAYLITGYSPGTQPQQPPPDRQRYKQVPYLTMHFLRTEDGLEDVGGDYVPTNQSSCKVQARWEWANSANSNRWGREFQAYRYKRFYMPSSVDDDFDTGFETIITKNKIRGKGRVVSFKMSTEPGKDCRILGWSMIMGSNGNV